MGRYRILLDSSRFGDGGENMHDSKEVICSSIETDVNDKYELSISIPSSSIVVYKYEAYSDIEIKELKIKNEAEAAKIEAEKNARMAKELAIKADEEAKKAADAEKLAKESLRLAQKARDEAEKKAKEAVKESIRIDEDMRKRLQELKSE